MSMRTLSILEKMILNCEVIRVCYFFPFFFSLLDVDDTSGGRRLGYNFWELRSRARSLTGDLLLLRKLIISILHAGENVVVWRWLLFFARLFETAAKWLARGILVWIWTCELMTLVWERESMQPYSYITIRPESLFLWKTDVEEKAVKRDICVTVNVQMWWIFEIQIAAVFTKLHEGKEELSFTLSLF